MSISLKTAFAPFNSISKAFTNGASQSSFGVLNQLLANDWFRALLLTIVSIFAGYTLQPVPKKLNVLFTNSTPFKYLILFILLLTAFYPLDNAKVILAIVVPVLTLAIFEFIRKADVSSVNTDTEDSVSSDEDTPILSCISTKINAKGLKLTNQFYNFKAMFNAKLRSLFLCSDNDSAIDASR
jgi:hypothetical protein